MAGEVPIRRQIVRAEPLVVRCKRLFEKLPVQAVQDVLHAENWLFMTIVYYTSTPYLCKGKTKNRLSQAAGAPRPQIPARSDSGRQPATAATKEVRTNKAKD